MRTVNLARRPFENLRPLRRLTTALWVLGGLFLLLNLWLYWDHLTGSSATRGRLADVRAEIERETAAFDELERQIAALEIKEQNETVTLLNRLITLRTFPWGLLFERLEQVLPADVRLASVQPEGQALELRRRSTRGNRRSGRTARASTRETELENGIVDIELVGTARDDAALNELIDAMFDDPTFQNPTLRNERRNDRGELDLSLSVEFLVDRAEELARGEVGAIPEPDLPPTSTFGDAPVEPAPRDAEGSRARADDDGRPASPASAALVGRNDRGAAAGVPARVVSSRSSAPPSRSSSPSSRSSGSPPGAARPTRFVGGVAPVVAPSSTDTPAAGAPPASGTAPSSTDATASADATASVASADADDATGVPDPTGTDLAESPADEDDEQTAAEDELADQPEEEDSDTRTTASASETARLRFGGQAR